MLMNPNPMTLPVKDNRQQKQIPRPLVMPAYDWMDGSVATDPGYRSVLLILLFNKTRYKEISIAFRAWLSIIY